MMTSLRSKLAVGKAVLAGLAVRGGIPHHFYTSVVRFFSLQNKNGAGRNRRATQPPAHFQRDPVDHGQLAVFPSGSRRTRTYQFRYGRFARGLKNGKLTRSDITIVCESVHWCPRKAKLVTDESSFFLYPHINH
jgi:hypothetical protein